jgi:hypothetical protein
VRLISNRAAASYEVMEAEDQTDEPVWPQEAMQQLIDLCFKDKVIKTLDHPVLKRLKGRKQ